MAKKRNSVPNIPVEVPKKRNSVPTEVPCIPTEVPYKPSLEVDAKKLGGKSLKVGERANLNIKGRVIEERIDKYEGGKRFYRVEIDEVSVFTNRRK